MNGFIFSIIIPTFRRPDVLQKTLDHLGNQRASFPFEVILVNDGPAEELPPLAFGTGSRTEWRLIQNETNLGRAATRNRGITAASGHYVLMLDDDIWAVPGLLQEHFDKQQQIGGGVVVGAVPPQPGIQRSIWQEYSIKKWKRIGERLAEPTIEYLLFLTGNVSIARSTLNEMGGFYEKFQNNYYCFEDTELGYRLFNAGIKFVHAPNAVGYHILNETFNCLRTKAYQTGRSYHVFVIRHPEVLKNLDYYSYIIGPWRGVDILKNLAKKMLSLGAVLLAMRLVLQTAGFMGFTTAIMTIMPWYEYGLRICGVRDEKRSKIHEQK